VVIHLRVNLEADHSIKQLFVETKRQICVIIRIQNGKHLLDVLERPATQKEEERFNVYKKQNAELRSRHNVLTSNPSTATIGSLATFEEFVLLLIMYPEIR
jgi:Ras GTPase-activating-like protein IQGAP2/3